jgi:dCTP deaminase
MLSDHDIERALNNGWFGVDPWEPNLLQPASLDMRLSGDFLISGTRKGTIDLAKPVPEEYYQRVTLQRKFEVWPGQFLLGATVERIYLSRYLGGRIEGKSSLGRVGLIVHSTAGYIDPGFKGQVTLEISNLSDHPIVVYVGMPVAQLSLFRLETPAREGYKGKYGAAQAPQVSQYYRNFEEGGSCAEL